MNIKIISLLILSFTGFFLKSQEPNSEFIFFINSNKQDTNSLLKLESANNFKENKKVEKNSFIILLNNLKKHKFKIIFLTIWASIQTTLIINQKKLLDKNCWSLSKSLSSESFFNLKKLKELKKEIKIKLGSGKQAKIKLFEQLEQEQSLLLFHDFIIKTINKFWINLFFCLNKTLANQIEIRLTKLEFIKQNI